MDILHLCTFVIYDGVLAGHCLEANPILKSPHLCVVPDSVRSRLEPSQNLRSCPMVSLKGFFVYSYGFLQ